jgi:hypothetical protein
LAPLHAPTRMRVWTPPPTSVSHLANSREGGAEAARSRRRKRASRASPAVCSLRTMRDISPAPDVASALTICHPTPKPLRRRCPGRRGHGRRFRFDPRLERAARFPYRVNGAGARPVRSSPEPRRSPKARPACRRAEPVRYLRKPHRGGLPVSGGRPRARTANAQAANTTNRGSGASSPAFSPERLEGAPGRTRSTPLSMRSSGPSRGGRLDTVVLAARSSAA